MKGTEKQIVWAEDIKVQVMDAAHEAYENGKDKKFGCTFEQSKVGHIAIFASENMEDAKFWIDSIGYAITDYEKRAEDAKSIADLAGIITGMSSHIANFDMSLFEQFESEEEELAVERNQAFKDQMKARREAKKNA